MADKRKKLKAIDPAFKSYPEADTTLHELNQHQAARDKIAAELNAAIDKVKVRFASRIDELDSKIARCDRDVKEFILYMHDKGDFEQKRSIKLAHGELGMRWDTPSLGYQPKIKVADVILKLKEQDMVDYVKVKENLDKPMLLQLDDGTLKLVGCRKVQDEHPFYKLPDHTPDKKEAAA